MVAIIKTSGEKEQFSQNKLLTSIKRAGIPADFHQKVLEHVQSKLYENIPTTEIYNHVKEFLSASPYAYTQARYSLKQAIMELGPTGYPFEDYIAKILQHMDYATSVRNIVKGQCITHEIDVIATKNTVIPTKIMIEAKFHNQPEIPTDVHVSLYTKARFDDIKEKNNFSQVWLVTNTRATIDAIAYAHCVGMKIISWSYPDGNSLREWVETYKLYPITALVSLSQAQKQQLLLKGIVLTKDICGNKALLDTLPTSQQEKEKIHLEALNVCQL